MITAMTMNDIQREMIAGKPLTTLTEINNTNQPSDSVVDQIERCLSAINRAHESLGRLESRAAAVIREKEVCRHEEPVAFGKGRSAMYYMLNEMQGMVEYLDSRINDITERVDL